jgi:hypothetical protein
MQIEPPGGVNLYLVRPTDDDSESVAKIIRFVPKLLADADGEALQGVSLEGILLRFKSRMASDFFKRRCANLKLEVVELN